MCVHLYSMCHHYIFSQHFCQYYGRLFFVFRLFSPIFLSHFCAFFMHFIICFSLLSLFYILFANSSTFSSRHSQSFKKRNSYKTAKGNPRHFVRSSLFLRNAWGSLWLFLTHKILLSSESGIPASAEYIFVIAAFEFTLAHHFFKCCFKRLMVRHIGIDIAACHRYVDHIVGVAQ